jgi:hypothetical protein
VDRVGRPGRLRQVVTILVFDLGSPLLAYALLRSAGLSAVAALVVSGALPAAGIAIGAVADRRLDLIGARALAGILIGSILSLTSHNARLYLLEGAVPRSCSRWPACSRPGCGGR